ncbi:hypothetical protein D3C78_1162170 [compost metagenome]
MQVAAVSDDPPLEQLAVAGQHDASLVGGDLGDPVVLEVVIVQRIEATHAQQVGQPAEVGVGDEAQHPQRMSVHLELRIDVQRFQPRIDGQAVAIEDHPFEADRFAVEQHQLDLGVRHPERLDHVLHRGGRRAGAGKHLPTPRGREEVVELLVEAECGPDHGASMAGEEGRAGGEGFTAPPQVCAAPHTGKPSPSPASRRPAR